MKRQVVLGLVLLGAAQPARGVSTRIWIQRTYDDFQSGQPRGVLVDSRGVLRPGPVLERVGTLGDVALVFCLLEAHGRVYLGSADKGEIWLWDGKRARKLVSLPEAVMVTSLVPWKDGVLAGTMPKGRIYFVSRNGKARLFAKLPAKHVWALAPDRRGGVFAATGPGGRLFRVDARGRARVYWKAPDVHLLSMTWGPGGALYVGTSPRAVVYRILGPGRARAVHDFDGTEVRALAGDGSRLFAAVNKMQPERNWDLKIPRIGRKPQGTRIQARKAKDAPRFQIPRKGAKRGLGGVFQVWPDGSAEQLWGLKGTYFTSLEIAKDGVYAAEGMRGRVFFLGSDKSRAMVADVKERQVLALNLTGRLPVLATGDAGGLYRVAARGVHEYVSKAFDAGSASRFGRLVVRAEGGKLVLETRTGNTAKPDAGWSRWQAVVGLGPWGPGRMAGLVASPPGRYVQYRIRWQAGGLVREVQVFHAPVNRGHRITELKVGNVGASSGKSKVVRAPWLGGKGVKPAATVKVSWKVDNPDGDPLWYRVYYRPLGSAVWRKLGWRTAPLTSTSVNWDVSRLPDGWYEVKVLASDARSNAPGRARTASRVSEPVLVDNTKPRIAGLAIRGSRVTGRVADASSRITGIQYSLDGETWYVVDAADGFYDEPAESFQFTLPKGLRRPAILLIRAFDAAGNTVVVKREIR